MGKLSTWDLKGSETLILFEMMHFSVRKLQPAQSCLCSRMVWVSFKEQCAQLYLDVARFPSVTEGSQKMDKVRALTRGNSANVNHFL